MTDAAIPCIHTASTPGTNEILGSASVEFAMNTKRIIMVILNEMLRSHLDRPGIGIGLSLKAREHFSLKSIGEGLPK